MSIQLIDEKAVIKQYTPFIYKMAQKYKNITLILGFDDIVSIGQLAAIEAQISYEDDKKASMSTYTLNLIRHRILTELYEATQLKRSQEHQITAVQLAIKELGEDATPEQMSKYMKGKYKNRTSMLSPTTIRSILDLMNIKHRSYDEMLEDPDGKFLKYLPTTVCDLDQQLDDHVKRECLRIAISELTERQQTVINMRLDEKTLEEVGQFLGCTRERVRQIQNQVIETLKKRVQARLR